MNTHSTTIKNVCKGVSFSIQILEKLEEDGLINDQPDFAVLKLPLEREGYWMKKLWIIWDKVLKSGSSKICGRQPLKNLKGYGLQSLFGPLLNTLIRISLRSQ